VTSTSPVPRPSAIVSFERLFLLTIGIGIGQAVVGWDELVERAPASTIVTMLGLTLGTQATLVLLVSRGRNSAAKWVLLAMLGIGLPLYFSSLERGTVIGWGMLSLLQALLQVASIALLFTTSARAWFRRR
jgi:hypothetical protein